MKRTLLLMVYTCAIQLTFAQIRVDFQVRDTLGRPVQELAIFLGHKAAATDSNGFASLSVAAGKYTLSTSHVGFEAIHKSVTIARDTLIVLRVRPSAEQLQEVVVTAREVAAPTSTSVIDRKAMQHLQPSSFTDLVSLLPGRSVSSPVLNRANTLTLREAGISSSQYSTGAMGVGFRVDGVPLNTNANMQETVGYDMLVTPQSSGVDGKRNTTRSGVDMRAIATDEIEKVEVVRGIPSVKYGDLSSGLVQITRKKGATKLSGRIKADGFSKLFYIGKGFDFKDKALTLNMSFDYLNAKTDPRNSFENYKRYTASLRSEKKFGAERRSALSLSLDYTGTFDEEKLDPDNSVRGDAYHSSFSNIRIASVFGTQLSEKWFKEVNVQASLSQSFDQITQDKFVSVKSAKAIATNWQEGEYYGVYMDPNYVSHLLIDGKPLDVFTDLSSTSEFEVFGLKSELLLGATYTYAKNRGRGQVYDIAHPPSEDMNIRPRAFSAVPAMQNAAFYVQDELSKEIGSVHLSLRAGLRGSSLLGLPENYKMRGRVYIDPRVNAMLRLPLAKFSSGKTLEGSLSAGWGKHSKLPTQEMLYPQDIYDDIEQLNYYHNNKDYRRVHYRTYIFSQANPALESAVNVKREARLGLSYGGHSLYVTYFNEKMDNGFRKMSDYHKVSYKKYDTSGIDSNNLTEAPRVEQLPFEEKNQLVLRSLESNGSATDKQGVEFQYAGKRLPLLHTRMTLSGAWLRTRYYNSQAALRFASTMTINNRTYYHLGVYPEVERYDRERFQSSFTADTYLEALGLITSLRCDLVWYTLDQNPPVSGVPTHYISEDGVRHPYTESERNDYLLQFLTYPTSRGTSLRVPMSMHLHLKISKQFYHYFTASMYVNNLFNYAESYQSNGLWVNRKGVVDPYFGMEMNINF